MVFGKIWEFLARIEEHFFTAQTDWISLTNAFFRHKIQGRSAERGSHQERSRLWQAVFTASEWEGEDWEIIEREQTELYDEYSESISTVRTMLKELDYTDEQVNGLVATLITNPEATTPERQEAFVQNWFALTRQLPGMTDEGINSDKQGLAVQSAYDSLKTQIKIEVMRWLPTPSTKELRNYLIDLTSYNDKGKTDFNMLSVCGVLENTVDDYLVPNSVYAGDNSKSIYQEIDEVQKEKESRYGKMPAKLPTKPKLKPVPCV
ncbi:hypothetical protein AbHV_ORF71 [Abalone herpesvirus Victoria/AUS/2009]|uniref:Uncharacterized protein n=1 Tax=Abalone herpesvirus (isolate Abalone/Australia/Victoria/2009) TaxID=1241371 RepID=K4JYI7_ABHV|nr:hypothetical protein AbHV_ORF71 [Abalone herpesvirus Victoria/AUS/2009]AFU90083.1 hypothetical protein AbHV_ORF71 [Abalone herpesvirus Victoria/AUS/2009]UCX57059.1 ORF69 [Haliotid herpesvirus 1]